jgi:hypothetical protein
MVAIKVENAYGKPGPAAGVAYEEHRTGAISRRQTASAHRRFRSPVGRQRDTLDVRGALSEGRRGLTYQRGKNVLSRRSSGVIAATQDQALSFDSDIPVRLHLGVQLVYHHRAAQRG